MTRQSVVTIPGWDAGYPHHPSPPCPSPTPPLPVLIYTSKRQRLGLLQIKTKRQRDSVLFAAVMEHKWDRKRDHTDLLCLQSKPRFLCPPVDKRERRTFSLFDSILTRVLVFSHCKNANLVHYMKNLFSKDTKKEMFKQMSSVYDSSAVIAIDYT